MRARKHFRIPDEFREQYKSIAHAVYSGIAGDVPGMEEGRRPYTPRVVVEIIRDANRIKMQAEQDLGADLAWSHNHPEYKHVTDDLAAFVEWIRVNEYSAAYQQDMDRAVREAVGL